MPSKRVTLKRIERALAIVAKVIRTHERGEAAWPIFDRLEAERANFLNREKRLEEALRRGEIDLE